VQLLILQAFYLGFSTESPQFSRILGRGAAEKGHGAYPYRWWKGGTESAPWRDNL